MRSVSTATITLKVTLLWAETCTRDTTNCREIMLRVLIFFVRSFLHKHGRFVPGFCEDEPAVPSVKCRTLNNRVRIVSLNYV